MSLDDSHSSLSASSADEPEWPARGKHYEPGLQDDIGMLNHFGRFEAPKPQDPTQKVFHISEYGLAGKSKDIGFVNESGLADYLSANPAEITEPGSCRYRLFYACAERVWDLPRRLYIRRFWSHYSVPLEVPFTFDLMSGPSFKVRETFSNSDCSSGGLLRELLDWFEPHSGLSKMGTPDMWMRCDLFHIVHNANHGSPYATPPLSNQRDNWIPSIYIRYNPGSQQSIVLVTDWARIYAALRNGCVYACQNSDDPPSNPFLILIWYLRCIISTAQTDCETKVGFLNGLEEKVLLKAVENDDYSNLLLDASRVQRGHQLTSRQLMVLQQNVYKIIEQHQRLAPIFEWPSNSRINVEAILKEIEADIGALFEQFQHYENYAAGLTDILLNKQQIKNGDRMREMAEENQKQAEATQAIAKDAKRDSEVMKAITIVTLIYLPATFVCTLLSMGVFKWEESGLKIAKMGWVFLAIATPLSVITCGLAFAWLWYAGKQMSSGEAVYEAAGGKGDDKAGQKDEDQAEQKGDKAEQEAGKAEQKGDEAKQNSGGEAEQTGNEAKQDSSGEAEQNGDRAGQNDDAVQQNGDDKVEPQIGDVEAGPQIGERPKRFTFRGIFFHIKGHPSRESDLGDESDIRR